jgi:NTP pyrophosphatase (non-canonical NTP hydrolase)
MATIKQEGIGALNVLQVRLAKWQKSNFKEEDCKAEWMIAGALEELGEAAHIILKARQKIRKYQNGFDEVAREDLKDAVGDAVVYLMQLCSQTKILFGEAIFDTADGVLERNWIEKKKDGVNE